MKMSIFSLELKEETLTWVKKTHMLLSRPSMPAWPSIWRFDDTTCLRGF